jgi:uncharacterized peroxidase-related enzyme
LENQHLPFKISLKAITIADADERTKSLLAIAKKQVGMIPNMYENMANFPAMLEAYGNGYQLFREEGGYSPVEQEIIFLTISKENGCDYCMAAHSVVADMISKVPLHITEAIRNDSTISDKKLKKLSEFTGIMLNKRGRPSQKDVAEFLEAGYTEKHILSIVLAISVKTLSNYANHLFDTPIDTAFKAREWSAYKLGRKLIQFFR